MTETSAARPRRFYATAEVLRRDGGFGVGLDGRAVKTPQGATLLVPSRALAEAVAAEWAAQGKTIDLVSMPLTRLVFLAIDKIEAARGDLAAQARAYAETDVVCFLSETDAVLRQREEAAWAPWRAWAAERLGVRLEVVEGVRARAQPEASLAAAEARAAGYDVFRLAGFGAALGVLGSAVLAFALVEGALDAETALAASRVDEDFQIERWGEDAEAVAALAGRRRDLSAVGILVKALNASAQDAVAD